MIDLPTHFALSITSSAIIGTAALVLAFLRIPHGGQWDKLSHARWVLFATFAILSFSGYFKACAAVTSCISSAEKWRKGPPLAVRMMRVMRSRRSPPRLWKMAECSLSTGSMGV